MNRLHFSIDIKAPKAKIWNALWNDHCYRDWASVFFEGSYFVCDQWKEGHTILFLDPDQNGIYSIIETLIPEQLIQFKHIGTVKKGEQMPIDDDSKVWSGATEQYSITEGEHSNTLHVAIDVMDEHLDFMKKTFPLALKKIAQNSI